MIHGPGGPFDREDIPSFRQQPRHWEIDDPKLEDDTNGPEVPGELQASHEMIGLESCGLIICFDCDLKMTGIFDISDDSHDGIVRNCLIETGEFESNEEEILATMSLSSVYTYFLGPSLANGFEVAALTDTGAAKIVVFAAFAREHQLPIEASPSLFRLGNSKTTRSTGKLMLHPIMLLCTSASIQANRLLGTVSMRWAFAEKPRNTRKIICHLLPRRPCDVILGKGFLAATKTMFKHRRRLTHCLLSVANVLRFNSLDNSRQLLEGKLAGGHDAFAVPDTGAEGNVMNLEHVPRWHC